MREYLEKSLTHLLNEEFEQAEALLHKYVVATARKIHEENCHGEDDALVKDWDSENYFTEEDLEDADLVSDDVPSEDDEVHMAGDEMAAAADDEQSALDDDAAAADDLSGLGDEGEDGEEGLDDEGEGGELDDERLSDIQAQLDRLTAEFDEKMAELTGDADEGSVDDDDDDDDVGLDDGVGDDGVDGDGEEQPIDDDEFDDLSESVLAELEKIAPEDDVDGKEVGAGPKITQNKTSPVPAKKANPADAKPVVTKQSSNDSFERETAPGTKPAPVKGARTRKSFADGMKTVDKTGDKSAALNKDFAK